MEQEEKNLEQTKKPKKISILKSPVKKVANVFDNIMKFGTIVLTGILLNALPKMMDTIKKVFNSISGFFSRVFNFFKPLAPSSLPNSAMHFEYSAGLSLKSLHLFSSAAKF